MNTATRQRGAWVGNSDELLSHGMRDLRAKALAIASAGLDACDAAQAVLDSVAPTGDGITVAGVEYRLAPGARLVVMGAGKATQPIAKALETRLGERIDAGLAILRRGVTSDLTRIEALVADHPIPSDDSELGAKRLIELADGLGPDDLVLACFTGGSSALASRAPEGVPVEDKRRLHELLIGSGMPITEINTVRKHVSDIKGGRLAEIIAPARIVNLTVSDVAGDVLDAITDLTVPDTTTAAEAIGVLHGHGLWDAVPESIQDHLRSPEAESPDLSEVEITTELLVTGTGACEAMAEAAKAEGLSPLILSTTLEGEAREMGRFMADIAVGSARRGRPFPPGSALVGCGGENVVRLGLEGAFGDGGPGQEAAVASALMMAGAPVAAVFMDTDGSDGGTEAAGAIADGRSAERASELGIDLRGALLAHTTRRALGGMDDLVVTGPTGTNVNDLFAVVIGEESE